jgi:hypothetical protein
MHIEVPTTERVIARCRAREWADGEPYLAFDADGIHMPTLRNVYIGLDLAPGTSLAEARALAHHVNVHSVGVHALILPDPPVDEAYAASADLDEAIDATLRHALIAALVAL